MNCCCDNDCDKNDTKSFTKCLEQRPASYDPKYCFNEQFIFLNNTQYVIEEQSSSLFCILVDNMETRNHYLEREATENVTVFNSLESRHRKFQWISTELTKSAHSMKSYSAGAPIWVKFKEFSNFGYLQLPTHFNSEFCQSARPVRYMEDFQSSCTLNLEDFPCSEEEILDGNSHFKNFDIVASPSFYDSQSNDSLDSNFDENAFVKIKTFLCDDKICDSFTEVTKIPRPTEKCENLVKSLKYNIYHDGTNGIDSVELFITISKRKNQEKYFSQDYAYNHFWTSENVTENYSKSGNPGYLAGKPVISGHLVENEEQPFIELNPKTLSVSEAGNDGLCDLNTVENRVPIEFGLNIKQGCSIFVNKTTLSEKCWDIKQKTFEMLAGIKFTDLETKLKLVATFGNSDVLKVGDWVRVLYHNIPDYGHADRPDPGRCPSLVKTLHIEILHASIGSLANPQAKIIGVMFKFGKPDDERFNCIGLACNHG